MQTQAAARLGNEFLSTPSARRATGRIATICNNVAKFLSTPSARRATCSFFFDGQIDVISIHALREEGDLIQHGQNLAQLVISIHTLREEGDTKSGDTWDLIALFLSTPSARRATVKQSTK